MSPLVLNPFKYPAIWAVLNSVDIEIESKVEDESWMIDIHLEVPLPTFIARLFD